MNELNCKAKLSVIIPVYNVEGYLRRCLDSLLAQSYPNLEIILCDDGSTDSSGAICDEYAAMDNRFVVIHQANEGVCTARNAAFKKVSGDFLTFVDADDFLEADAYEKVMAAMEDCGADACFFGWRRLYENSGSVEDTFKGQSGTGTAEEAVRQALIFDGYAGHIWNKVFSTAYWRENGSVNLPEMNPAFAVGEDCEWLVRMMRPYQKVVFLTDRLYNYLVRQNSAVNIQKLTNARLTEIPAREKIAEEVTETWPGLEAAARAKAYSRLIQNGKLAFRLRDKHAAAQIRPYLARNRRSYIRSDEINIKQKIKAVLIEALIRFT